MANMLRIENKICCCYCNVLSLDVQPHFTQYLLREGILVTRELITALSTEVSAGGAKLGGMPKTPLFHINDFKQYDLMPYQKFLQTPLSGAPQKCFQSGLALAKAGPAYRPATPWWSITTFTTPGLSQCVH